jgi:4'-phosphopantetheinyl transferase
MEIYAVKILNINKSVFDELMMFIDSEKKNRIIGFLKEEDKNRALIAEILIRYIILKKIDIKNIDITFSKNKFGKPFLKGHHKISFNISHSGNYVLCAVDDKDIGIDIEKICDINYMELLKKIFINEEIEFILNGTSEKRIKNFYKMWTLKESYIKADGRGLSIPLKSFCITIDKFKNIKIKTSNRLKNCYFKQFDLDDEYEIAVCSLNSNITNDIIIISQDELISKFIKCVR